MSATNLIFTVYASKIGVEIRTGCYEDCDIRVICTCRSYEVAQNLGRLAAKMNNLPLIDHVQTAEHPG